MMLSVLITIVVVVPYILIALVPLFLFYGWIQRVYRNTARELKRFDRYVTSVFVIHVGGTRGTRGVTSSIKKTGSESHRGVELILAMCFFIFVIFVSLTLPLRSILDSATQSPIFNYFAETVNGLSSVRAFQCEERLMKETTHRIDYNSRFWTKNNFVNRWLGLRLDWIGVSACSVFSIFLPILLSYLKSR